MPSRGFHRAFGRSCRTFGYSFEQRLQKVRGWKLSRFGRRFTGTNRSVKPIGINKATERHPAMEIEDERVFDA